MNTSKEGEEKLQKTESTNYKHVRKIHAMTTVASLLRRDSPVQLHHTPLPTMILEKRTLRSQEINHPMKNAPCSIPTIFTLQQGTHSISTTTLTRPSAHTELAKLLFAASQAALSDTFCRPVVNITNTEYLSDLSEAGSVGAFRIQG